VLVVHFVVVVMLALVFTIISMFHRDKGPIPPALAFISWISVAYQSLAIELPYAYGNPAVVVYEPYTGGAALSLYFLGMSGIMFLYLVHAVFEFIGRR